MFERLALALTILAVGAMTMIAMVQPVDARGGHGGGGGGRGGGGGGFHGGGGGFHGGGLRVSSFAVARSAPVFRSAPVAFRSAQVIHRGPIIHRRAHAPVYVASYGGGCNWLRHRAMETGSPYWWERYRRCVGYY